MASIMEQAAEKLNTELNGIKQPYMEKPVVEYLCGILDEPLAEQVVLDHKTLKKCIEYIRSEARKKLNGNNGYLPDQEVYDMAIVYFQIDDAEEERKKAAEAEKRRKEQEERQLKAKADKEAKQAEKQVAQKPKPDQLSLFDGLEGANA